MVPKLSSLKINRDPVAPGSLIAPKSRDEVTLPPKSILRR